MTMRSTDRLDRTRLAGRRDREPSPFTARAAGLYSEVVWDRNWTEPSPRTRAAMNDGDHQAPPLE
ncbi:hypothetical protein [Brevundimonas sp.]|uniref:hypothetical protein n=1 Tax=Brevundimonas sp. TaxID=1871086 RepID=UPI002D688177|nr:hypothetical protein [Brevundimonas sp.]HYC98042.1 hypothetical protein [Brevundimonas sp.]